VPGRIIVAVGDDRFWQPLARVFQRRARAERSWLIASRVVTVVTKALGDAICSPPSSA
jgi:hypothetical protein